MAVFRIEKTRDDTVMANHHLRNTKRAVAFFIIFHRITFYRSSMYFGFDYP